MQKIFQSAAAYKLAILYGVMFTLNSIAVSATSSLAGVDHWDQLLVTQKLVIIAGMCAQVSSTLMAFFNRSIARIESGKSPIETGDTAHPFKPEPKAT